MNGKNLKLTGKNWKQKNEIVNSIDFEKLEQTMDLTDQAISKYSLKNQILILLQKPMVFELRGFKDWQQHFRKPLKGTGISILAPTKIKNRDTDEYEIKGFRYITVFDINDTVPMNEYELKKAGLYETYLKTKKTTP